MSRRIKKKKKQFSSICGPTYIEINYDKAMWCLYCWISP